MEKAKKIISASDVKSIKANKSEKSIRIHLVCNEYVCINDELNIRKFFRNKFNIKKVILEIEHDSEMFDEVIKNDIINRLVHKEPLISPFKNDICIRNEKNECIIEIPDIAKNLMEFDKTSKNLYQYIKKINKKIDDVKIVYIDNPAQKNNISIVKNAIEKETKEQSKHIFKESVKKEKEKASFYAQSNIKGELVKIVDINSQLKRVIIQGEIIDVLFKVINAKTEIVTFDVTDYTSTITCKTFLNAKNTKNIRENVVLNNYVTVEGDYVFDTYERQNVITLKKIEPTKRKIITDDCEVKRVELHLHTKMSSMDGFIEPKSLFKTLSEWGHKYIAITDHGVLQAYPEVQVLAKKYGITPIYGLEAYLVVDNEAYVYNPTDTTLDQDYAAVYIQTDEIEISICRDHRIVEKNNFRVSNTDEIDDYINGLAVVVMCDDQRSSIINFLREKNIEIIRLDPIVKKMFDCNITEEFLLEKYNIEHLHDSVTVYSFYEKFISGIINNHVESTNELCISLVSTSEYKTKTRYHAILLAKNPVGLKNLYEMVSYSHLNFYYKKPNIPKSILDAKRNGIIVGSACEAGELYKAVLHKEEESVLCNIAAFYDYLEIQPVGNNEYMVREEIVKSVNDIIDMNKKIVELGKQLAIPVVATCDAHFLNARDDIFRGIIMQGQKFKDAKNQPPLYLRTTKEMLAEFEYLDSETRDEVVISNPLKIASMIETLSPIPDGTFPPEIDGSDESLRNSTISRAKEIYGEILPEIVSERMNRELDSIISHGFSVMYIIAQKLVTKSLSDGYLVGSRGSVGSSFVAFLSGITEVNSLQAHYVCPKCKHVDFNVPEDADCGVDLDDRNCSECGTPYIKSGFDIPFETFLGFYGDKEPDIDLNFSGDYQSVAHKYVEEIFGEKNVFRAGTISTIASKTAFGFVKNYMEESEQHINKAELNRLIKGCEGVKKTTGQHPGGIMVMPKGYSIHQFTPIQHPADATDSEIITTHFDFNSLHGRLLKLDILGHDDPTVLKKLHVLTGIDPTTIDIVDEKIISLFVTNKALNVKEETTTSIGVLGIPEFGTKFVRGMLYSTKPSTFSELVKISGLSHGTDVWANNAEELISNKTATLNEVICTRDDIMLYLLNKGVEDKKAFDIMEKVRKGKGITDEEEKMMYEKKVPKWYIESCKKIKYMFPKAHAVAYVVMALRVAWYKIYYPLEYYAAFLSIRALEFDYILMGKGVEYARNYLKHFDDQDGKLSAKDKKLYTITEIIIEFYARGYDFLPVDLYKSDSKYFLVEDGKLRVPFTSIMGLGENASLRIVKERVVKKFMSIDDLKLRGQVSKTVIEKLLDMDVLKGLPETSQVTFF